jgi:hypothetical protein
MSQGETLSHCGQYRYFRGSRPKWARRQAIESHGRDRLHERLGGGGVDGCGRPLFIRRDHGRGSVFVAASSPGSESGAADPYPRASLDEHPSRYIPFRISGKVQTLVNRTDDGWAVMVVNNNGITKEPNRDALPVLDPGQTQVVVISFCCEVAEASDMASQQPLEVHRTATGREARIQSRLAPGDLKMVSIKSDLDY